MSMEQIQVCLLGPILDPYLRPIIYYLRNEG